MRQLIRFEKPRNDNRIQTIQANDDDLLDGVALRLSGHPILTKNAGPAQSASQAPGARTRRRSILT
jgi:hypothetical protein